MPPQPSATQIRLNNITTCLTITSNTLHVLASSLKGPFLEAISNTTQSLLEHIQTVKKNKNDCTELLEQTYQLLNAIMMVHIKSDTGGELPPSVLNHIGKFTETLHKIHTFVEAQQVGSKVKNFFRKGETSRLLNECKAGLQQGFDVFEIHTANIMNDITKMQEDAENRHKEVLNMIEALSDTANKQGLFRHTQQLKALPQSPCYHLSQRYSMAESQNYQTFIVFLAKDHPGLQFWVEEEWERQAWQEQLFIIQKLLADTSRSVWSILHWCQITMRGAERPAKVAWTRPFLQPLKPLEQDAAMKTFIDIADNTHNPEEVNKVLALTDNMPLAINLLAHLVDSEGCTSVLSRWEEEKTSLISEGYDKRSNLELSISLSLSSTRLDSFPHSKDLLSLLSMLPDGLSDVELVQAKLPMDNILGCKAALIQTTLAYSDEHKRLKALAPIQEYMQKIKPPGNHLVQPLLQHFKELLELFMEYRGTQSNSATVARISSNYSNIQNILWNGAQQGHPDLVNTIYCACDLDHFSQLIGWGPISFTCQIRNILPRPCDHRLEASYILTLFNSLKHSPNSITETLVFEALEHFKHFDDPDLKFYYQINCDLFTAKKFCATAISLAFSTRNTKMQSHALTNLAWINWCHGDYFTAQVHAKEAQRLVRLSADLYREAQALRIESMCCYSLGNHKHSISLCSRARDLIALCGMSSGELDHIIMITQAELHKSKSEYVEARNIHFMILQETSVDQDSYTYGITLLNVAEIDVAIGAPKEDFQGVYEKAREIFSTRNHVTEVVMCDAILADLSLREANFLTAKTLFESCLKSSVRYSELMSYCLERLGDVSCWGSPNWMSGWTTVFFVHSVRQKEKLGIYKALEFFGDVFLAQGDEHTATSLFTVALDGFTKMDVHRSRAECMLQLGDISKGHGDLLKAVELWTTARPLFEKSSQAKQVENIDQRLTGVDEDVLEQHRKNLAHLAELNAPSGTADEISDLSDIEDMEGLDL
ncbi:hypothetical protein B0H13DRAFT_1895237 [Mycena leptocephala]|nr:hypothetical protein B0H13DRAFT_1895237 [Mycena leptocephala]